MKITLTESNIDSLIGQYIKCFEYVDADCGDLCYTLDEPFNESNIVYQLIHDINIIGIYICFKFDESDIDLYYSDEIEIFDTNPEPKFVSLDF